MVSSQCLFSSSKCTIKHSLRVQETVLLNVEDPKVVNRAEGGNMISSQCPFCSSKSAFIHSLRIGETPLASVEKPHVVNRVEGGNMVSSKCSFFSRNFERVHTFSPHRRDALDQRREARGC